ncbi:DUF1206 domain-containing protein [Saxibacter everestensis]|uniref:DUF1206 domain-containing protein n=1 Tax=Saxibacter everestensis TaxID=2909229 RepID=A0ABY8QX85_9MICO|nr:DUF1206 domain-containing protein [Brevibacteriaceae bacterium ZFBP1038]
MVTGKGAKDAADDASESAAHAGKQAGNAARQAGDSKTLETVGRWGFFFSGLLHVLIGLLALRIGFGGSGGNADQTGALAEIAGKPGGAAVLWVAVCAFFALGLWQVTEILFGARAAKDREKLKHRAKSLGQAIVYFALGSSALTFALGGSKDSGKQSSGVSAQLMQSTAGKGVLIVGGAIILGVGVYYVVKGLRQKHREQLKDTSSTLGRTVVWLGTIGYPAKGVALGVVGILFAFAAITADPKKAQGIDAAVKTLGSSPAGSVLLIIVGLGVIVFGLYLMGRTKTGKM